jgi:hypothetical protein
VLIKVSHLKICIQQKHKKFYKIDITQDKTPHILFIHIPNTQYNKHHKTVTMHHRPSRLLEEVELDWSLVMKKLVVWELEGL